jgi:hypothetical protein
MGLKLTAELYRRGAGTPKNLERAAYWARIAALRGDDMAMVTLTMVYAESKGAVVSEIEAFEWMRKCDALGNATCSLFLGHAYQVGTATTPKDRDQAILYLRKAAAKGNATAKAALAELGAAP